MSYDAKCLAPYRVEWRPNLVTGWLLIESRDEREDASAAAQRALDSWGGQARIITQHVIEVVPEGNVPARHP